VKLAAIMLAALTLCACARTTAPQVTVLTYASPYAPSHPFSQADITWMKWVEKRSGGRLRIQPYWSGSVLSSEHSMSELRHGVVDIGLITPIYVRGGTHLIRTQAAFYAGLTSFRQQVALYHCLADADPQFQHELQGLVVLAVQGGNLPGILTRNRPLRRLEDLQGLRLRAPAELLAVLRHFGADPVEMPMGDVYAALAKGVLDGVVAPADTLKSLHFAEVAHYFSKLHIPRGAYAARAMGEQRWKSLTDEERNILRDAVAVWEDALDSQLTLAERSGEVVGHEHGIEFLTPTPQDVERFLDGYDRFAAQAAARLQQRFNIDGETPYRYARALVAASAANGTIECKGEGT
jgi:TRAP-type C4-dicarboxylate transport system substrate-binding protein